MNNTFVHNELHTTDPEISRKFFDERFDWDFEDVDMDGMKYTLVKSGEQGIGGIIKQTAPGAPSVFLSYVQVEDLSTCTKKATELGGTVMVENQPAGDYGHFSVVQDPTGAVFALWQQTK